MIGILTPHSLESGWVMFELGAAWGSVKTVLPVVAGVEYEGLPGPLSETNVTDAASRPELEQLFQEISDFLGFAKRAAGRATSPIDTLVEEAETYFEDDDDDDAEGDDDEEEVKKPKKRR